MNISKRSLLFLLIVMSSFGLKATNYYVSNSGSNSNTGLSLGDAFLTIQHAVDLVIAGDTVFVENGTYAGFDIRNVNGTAVNPIVFEGAGNNVVINQSGPLRDDGINIENADYIIIDGFIINNMTGNGNGIRVVLSDNCIIRNCFCDNNAERGIFTGFTDDIIIEYNVCSNSVDEHGIYVSNSSDRPIIRFNECYGNNNIGIHLNGDLSAGGDGIISDALIYGNIIHDNKLAAGINMDGLQNPTVYNNLIYNNHNAQGIALFQLDGTIVTYGAKIYNNTIIVPSDGRWGVLVKDGANINTEIYNNIIINQHAFRGCISVENIAQFTSDYNILNDKMSDNGDGSTINLAAWQALGLDTNSLLANPVNSIFVNPTLNDFNLATGSQAIDAGTNLVSGIVTDDINGNTRPIGIEYDVGAFEFENTPSENNINISPIALLQGAMLNPNTGEENLMRDDLQVLDYIPITSPYTDALTCDSSVFTATGQDAIVDWVLVELRDENDNSDILKSQSALLQRDGDVVGIDGVSALNIMISPSNYYVSIKHRNHLGIMSSSAIALSGTVTTVNFADGSVATHGSNAQTILGMPVSTIGMWSGDSNGEGIVQYSGATPEGPVVLSYVLNDSSNFLNLPTFSIAGYSATDVDMDGQTQYAGGTSEMPIILQNVLTNPANFLNLITWPIEAQLPETAGKVMKQRTEFENKINNKN